MTGRLSRSTCALLLLTGAALVPVAGAHAARNELFKCVNGAGVVSIQSVPCPAGSVLAWRRAATPEPPQTAEQMAQAQAKQLRDQQAVRELSEQLAKKQAPAMPVMPTPAPMPIPKPAAALPTAGETADVLTCQTAQAFAGSVREKEWLGLTDEQMRRLFGWVAEQCKIPVKDK